MSFHNWLPGRPTFDWKKNKTTTWSNVLCAPNIGLLPCHRNPFEQPNSHRPAVEPLRKPGALYNVGLIVFHNRCLSGTRSFEVSRKPPYMYRKDGGKTDCLRFPRRQASLYLGGMLLETDFLESIPIGIMISETPKETSHLFINQHMLHLLGPLWSKVTYFLLTTSFPHKNFTVLHERWYLEWRTLEKSEVGIEFHSLNLYLTQDTM